MGDTRSLDYGSHEPELLQLFILIQFLVLVRPCGLGRTLAKFVSPKAPNP